MLNTIRVPVGNEDSRPTAERFIKLWAGMLLDEAAQARVTKHRWPEGEGLKERA
jgi:hypothetical protein